ncbi:MAG: hypothetical protein MRQ13_00115 [Candidatus Midichloria sp.]|nr:hypothetical protein [Candidatus Midichloria sp.]
MPPTIVIFEGDSSSFSNFAPIVVSVSVVEDAVLFVVELSVVGIVEAFVGNKWWVILLSDRSGWLSDCSR